jgi:hypothetical protein
MNRQMCKRRAVVVGWYVTVAAVKRWLRGGVRKRGNVIDREGCDGRHGSVGGDQRRERIQEMN